MNDSQVITHVRYLPPEADAERWGLCVVGCGYSEIPPGSAYPPAVRQQHPGEYSLSWEKGRTLSEYQLVYINEGRGIFESEPTGPVRVEGGHVFLLFPGIWHRFRPVKKVGWDESWIGFNGDVAERIMNGFFAPDKAVVRVGNNQELKDLIRSVAGILDKAPPGYQQLLAARTMEALALIRSCAMSFDAGNPEAARKIEQACRHLARHYRETVDMNQLAKELGLSYSRFRHLFKEQTGSAPHQYQLEIRLNLARYWLIDSDLSVSQVAERLGFSTVQYFSCLFKKAVGCPPGAYRKH